MTPEESLLQIIETMLKKIPSSVTIGTVGDVDKSKRTCTIKREGAADLYDVRLNSIIDNHADHFTVFPKKGTYALCLTLDNPANYFVLAIAEPEEISLKIGNSELKANKDGWIFNGGTLSGLVKIESLVSKLNTLEQRMGSHQHLYTPAGSSSPIPTTLDAATNPTITNTKKSDIENPKIKQ